MWILQVGELFEEWTKVKNHVFSCDGIFYKEWGFDEVNKSKKASKSEYLQPLLWE